MQARLRTAVRAFDAPGFTWLALCRFALWGAWSMETIIHGWAVLQLTDSPLWVGVAASVRGGVHMAMSLVGGTLADRFDRRRLLIAANASTASVILLLGVLWNVGVLSLWHILVALAVTGVIDAVRGPAFSALTFDIVGSERILNADALFVMGGSVFRGGASLVTGVTLATFGVGTAYLAVSVVFMVSALVPLGLRRASSPTHSTESAGAALRSGFRYVLATPPIREALYLSLVAELFGFAYMAMLPVMARDVLQAGATGLGALSAAVSVGQFCAMVGLASFGSVARRGGLMLTSMLCFGLAVAAFGLSPVFALSLVLAAIVGSSASLYDAAIGVVLQIAVDPDMRGRVLGLYTATWGASNVGGLLMGALGTAITVPLALALGGTVIAAHAVLYLRRRHLWAEAPAPT